MASGKALDEPTAEEQAQYQARWEQKRRADLANSIGIIISVPPSNLNDENEWQFGLSNSYTEWPELLFEQFQNEMVTIVRESMEPLLSSGMISSAELNQVQIFEYSVGPAAQEWPKFLIDLYLDFRPFVNDSASLLAWGTAIGGALKKFRVWERTKSALSRTRSTPLVDPVTNEPTYTPEVVPIELNLILTRDALVAICYLHLDSFYQPVMPITINAFTRGNDYCSPDHPGGTEQYLITFQTGLRKYAYLVNGYGRVLEHFIETDGATVLVPLPRLVQEEYAPVTTVFPTFSETLFEGKDPNSAA